MNETDTIERLPVGAIIAAATRLTQYAPDEIRGECRSRGLVRVRQAICWVAKHTNGTNISYPRLGVMLGGRDHSTIIHGVTTAEAVAARDPAYAEFLRNLELTARAIGMSHMIEPERIWGEPTPARPPRPPRAPRRTRRARPVAAPRAAPRYPIPKPIIKPLNLQEQEQEHVDDGVREYWLSDEDGDTRHDRICQNDIITGSWRLACAILKARAA